jgi:hypothetical protein
VLVWHAATSQGFLRDPLAWHLPHSIRFQIWQRDGFCQARDSAWGGNVYDVVALAAVARESHAKMASGTKSSIAIRPSTVGVGAPRTATETILANPPAKNTARRRRKTGAYLPRSEAQNQRSAHRERRPVEPILAIERRVGDDVHGDLCPEQDVGVQAENEVEGADEDAEGRQDAEESRQSGHWMFPGRWGRFENRQPASRCFPETRCGGDPRPRRTLRWDRSRRAGYPRAPSLRPGRSSAGPARHPSPCAPSPARSR